ncbi:response regulator [Hahella sp. KA22]|nr:response regulator [Hahella sp. HN01]AZZ92770.1 response regulator [Hahella sp. KA22]MBU6954556.1 response regulator [Hahella sp. HN01]QAY56144.1 response regulator [Hahella sp. KA22]
MASDRCRGDNIVRSKRVLVVEDNPDDIALIKRVLDRKDIHCQLEFVDNGAKALYQVQQAKYDLIILDIGLPIANGFEVMSAVRKPGANQHTPIVILTDSVSDDRAKQCMAAGASSVVDKSSNNVTDFYGRIYAIFSYWLTVNHCQLAR